MKTKLKLAEENVRRLEGALTAARIELAREQEAAAEAAEIFSASAYAHADSAARLQHRLSRPHPFSR